MLLPVTAMRTTTPFICAIALATLAALAHAADAGAAALDAAAISAVAENAVRASAGAAANQLLLQSAPLDPRLRVAACDRALTGFLTDTSPLRFQTTVGVRCEGSVRWTIYTSVRVETQAPVLVARKPLARDDELNADDFRLETRRVPGLLSAYVTDVTALKGQRLRRALAVDDPLSFDALAPANLIHRGQSVVLVAHAGGLEVRMNGVALADGRASEHIRVQNTSSQRIVEGIVRSDTVVEAPL
jgi:flagella basal body P-ring formation protein FlgA